ncbi:hypothetical protein Q9L42_021085 (plasmid) [Methylomarinum sp. Ch1-1]|uniref:Uncharacterized protein n=1 Tax=Methylomarinum roseum TaxID=3067653 RepID=A0AAU7P0N0_9GAMM|nr:hypothetical protein [Methylomarinum sp. Ch1-1]MDP4523149.1 hypothetical protein [Methylomarinum sp. Ch1-1]
MGLNINFQNSNDAQTFQFEPELINAPLLSLNGTSIEDWPDKLYSQFRQQSQYASMISEAENLMQEHHALIDAGKAILDFHDQLEAISRGLDIGLFMLNGNDDSALKFLFKTYQAFIAPGLKLARSENISDSFHQNRARNPVL